MSPGYEDVDNLMRKALEMGTLKVVAEPVNYNRYSWSYWGFQNDYLQQQMVADLNAGSYANTRFYTGMRRRSGYQQIGWCK